MPGFFPANATENIIENLVRLAFSQSNSSEPSSEAPFTPAAANNDQGIEIAMKVGFALLLLALCCVCYKINCSPAAREERYLREQEERRRIFWASVD